jgi:hypothetical protein
MFEWFNNLASGASVLTCILAGVFFAYIFCRKMFGHQKQLLYNPVVRADVLLKQVLLESNKDTLPKYVNWRNSLTQ